MAETKITVLSRNFFKNSIRFAEKNRYEMIVLFIILFVGSFVRFYRIADYMTFLGDEGRDAIVVRRLLTDLDPILIGPGTSIGNMYLGPLYYYFIAPSLLFANFSPVGPAVMVALFGILTTFFVWLVVREWFPSFKGGALPSIHVGALAAAGLYAVSSTVVHFSRSSWNPNIMPFFSLLTVYAVWKIWEKREFKWLFVLGVSFAFVLQSHYLGLLLFPVTLLYWFLSLKTINHIPLSSKKKVKSVFIKYTLIGVVVFTILMSPLLIFDMRHNWPNLSAMKTFFTERQTTVSARPWTSLPKIPEIGSQISTSLLTGKNQPAGRVITLSLALVCLFVLVQILVVKKKKLSLSDRSFLLLVFWIASALVGLGVYKQHIYDHYFGFVFAVPFLLTGFFLQRAWEFMLDKNKILRFTIYYLLFTTVGYLIFLNLRDSYLLTAPGNQLARSINVANKMIEESYGRKFNMAVIAERNYEGAYQYFLEKEGANFVMIDPQREKETVAEELFVVCELPRDKCDPTTNPKAGIANFGWSRVEAEWAVDGVILYKLVHTQP